MPVSTCHAPRALVCTLLTCIGMYVLELRAQDITAAPAFPDAQLTALPSSNWITNGGNTYNQRYSPLSRARILVQVVRR
jgi:glucose dehydrogenase